MTIKVSSLMGMDVYTDSAKHLGKVYDIIIDLQKGEVVRLTLEPIKVANKEDAKRIFKEKTVMYKSVKAAEKIIIVSAVGSSEDDAEMSDDTTASTAAAPAKPFEHYSYRYKR